MKDLTRDQTIRNATDFANVHGMGDDKEYFVKGALLARNGEMDGLSEEEKEWIRKETTNKWKQPLTLYYLSIMCAMCAVVQGMDESVVNGAQLYYPDRLGLTKMAQDNPNQATWIEGLVLVRRTLLVQL